MLLTYAASLGAALVPLTLPIARHFEYEYASLNAWLCLLLIPMSGLARAPRHWRDFALSLFLNALPASLAFGLGSCPCSPRDFWLFYALQVLPHFGLAWVALIFIADDRFAKQNLPRNSSLRAWLASRLARPWQRLFVVWMLLLLLLAHFASQMWWQPQKRSTHIISGWIHGALYDHWLPLDAGIFWARGAHMLFALWLFCLLRRLKWQYLFPPALGFLLCLSQSSGYSSQGHGLSVLTRQMPQVKDDGILRLYYQNPRQEPAYEERVEELFQAAQFHARELFAILEVTPFPLTIFVYPSTDSKKLGFGGGGTDITDVVTPSIHITLDSWPHPTLRHELVHAISSEFAFFGLGFHPNMILTEGLAVALAPEEEGLSLHEGAKIILSKGHIKNLENLFSPLFWQESSTRAYTIAGSFLQYLLQQQGPARLKQLYAGQSFRKVYHKDTKAVLEDWQAFLASEIKVSANSLQGEALYRFPGILYDTCPHTKALLRRPASDAIVQWRQGKDWQSDRDFWPWMHRLEATPETRLQLFRQKVLATHPSPDLLTEWQQHRRVPPQALEDLSYFLLGIDLMITESKLKQAKAELESYYQLIQGLDIGKAQTRQILARILLLSLPESEEQKAFLRLLGQRIRPDEISLSETSSPWIISYLKLKNQLVEPTNRLWLDRISAIALPSGLPPSFGEEWWRSIAEYYRKQRRFGLAAKALSQAQGFAGSGTYEALGVYIRMMKDFEQRSGPPREAAPK